MLTAIRDHLKAELTASHWAGVGVAEEIDELARLAGTVDDGTAIIMPWGEKAQPQQLSTGEFRQLVEMQFAIGIVLREYDQEMGGDRAIRFDTFKAELEAAMAGWEAPDSFDPFELIAGESSPITTGVSIYVQTWATTRILTGA